MVRSSATRSRHRGAGDHRALRHTGAPFLFRWAGWGIRRGKSFRESAVARPISPWRGTPPAVSLLSRLDGVLSCDRGMPESARSRALSSAVEDLSRQRLPAPRCGPPRRGRLRALSRHRAACLGCQRAGVGSLAPRRAAVCHLAPAGPGRRALAQPSQQRGCRRVACGLSLRQVTALAERSNPA